MACLGLCPVGMKARTVACLEGSLLVPDNWLALFFLEPCYSEQIFLEITVLLYFCGGMKTEFLEYNEVTVVHVGTSCTCIW